MRIRRLLLFAACALAVLLAARLWNGSENEARAAPVYLVPGDINGDGVMDIADPVYLLMCLFVAEECPGGPAACPGNGELCGLLQTGQEDLWLPIPPFEPISPPPGDPFFGQDGGYRAGLPRVFTVQQVDPTDQDTWVVVDETVGLMWQYSGPWERMPFDQALVYCGELELAGYTDWRLPNIRELESLVDYGRAEPAIDEDFFDCQSAAYWSSTSYQADPGQAWVVNFHDGMTILASKGAGYHFYVRAVRSAR